MTIPNMPTSSKRILVVDDDPLVCESMRLLLEADGYAVETVLSSEAALHLFQKGTYHAVILDYAMPDMNGLRLAAAIKALDFQQKILMLTAYPEMLLSPGKPLPHIDVLLSKPVEFAELFKALQDSSNPTLDLGSP